MAVYLIDVEGFKVVANGDIEDAALRADLLLNGSDSVDAAIDNMGYFEYRKYAVKELQPKEITRQEAHAYLDSALDGDTKISLTLN
jgi:hypothetical protein